MWSNNTINKLFCIQKEISNKFEESSIRRTEFKKLIRLKIGHCLFTHKYIIEKTDPPLCNCGARLTVLHLFNECDYENLRTKYNIESLMILNNEEAFPNIKNYLEELNLYNII